MQVHVHRGGVLEWDRKCAEIVLEDCTVGWAGELAPERLGRRREG